MRSTGSFFSWMLIVASCVLPSFALSAGAWPQSTPRAEGDGEGPFSRLIIQAGMLIDGSGGPPQGPALIVIEGNRIVEIVHGSSQTGEMKRIEPRPGDRIIDARDAYVLPGFIDSQVRLIESYGRANTPPVYPFKLLLAHGITTISSQQRLGEQAQWALDLAAKSAANTIVAPRIEVWVEFGAGSPEEARRIVREAKKSGIAGLGEGWIEGPPAVMKAGIEEAKKVGLPTIWHMDSNYTSQFDVVDAARAGMTGAVHWYGITDALLKGLPQPQYSDDVNFNKGRSKFGNAGRLWKQVAAPGSKRWNEVLDELVALDFTLQPTFSVYEAHRDYMGVSGAEWNRDYLHPVFAKDFTPGGGVSHFYEWTTADEVEWKNNYRLWMAFVNEFKNRGGRVTAGSDAGYTWELFGFGFIRNLELFQEAGFTPLEAIRAGTLSGAEAMGIADEVGSVEVGKLADLVIVDGNPLHNLKTLYGTGVISLAADGSAKRTGGVRLTVKNGVVFDAKRLLADVRKLVVDARAVPAAPAP